MTQIRWIYWTLLLFKLFTKPTIRFLKMDNHRIFLLRRMVDHRNDPNFSAKQKKICVHPCLPTGRRQTRVIRVPIFHIEDVSTR